MALVLSKRRKENVQPKDSSRQTPGLCFFPPAGGSVGRPIGGDQAGRRTGQHHRGPGPPPARAGGGPGPSPCAPHTPPPSCRAGRPAALGTPPVRDVPISSVGRG